MKTTRRDVSADSKALTFLSSKEWLIEVRAKRDIISKNKPARIGITFYWTFRYVPKKVLGPRSQNHFFSKIPRCSCGWWNVMENRKLALESAPDFGTLFFKGIP